VVRRDTGVRVGRRALGAVYVAGGASAFGTQMTLLALPWLILESTGSAAQTGLVFAVQVLPLALLGFAGGEVIHRLGARRTMLLADAARAPIVALVPILVAWDALGLGALLVIVATLGVLSVPYFAAQRVLTGELAGPDPRTLTRANSVLEGGLNAAALIGPALAGVLITVLGGAERVLLIDAGTFALSFLLLLRLVPAGSGPAPRTDTAGIGRGALAGLRALRADPFLRRVLVSTMIFGFQLRVLAIALPLLAFDRFGGDSRLGGLLVAGYGAGALAGSVATYLISGRVRPPRLIGVAAVQLSVPLWLLVPDLPVGPLIVAVAVSSAAVPLSNAPFFSMLATRFPDGVRARAVQAAITVGGITGPVGFLAGGAAMDGFGITPTLLGVAVLSSVATLNVLWALRGLGSARSGTEDWAGPRRAGLRGRPGPHPGLPLGTRPSGR
jgi:Transmembrane secretion effector